MPPVTLNTSIFSGLRGILRIATLIIGLIDLGITADKYVRFDKEKFFLAIVIIAFIVSIVWTIILLLGVLDPSGQATLIRNADSGIHIGFGIFLVISAIVFLVSVFDLGNYYCDLLRFQKVMSRHLGYTCDSSWYIFRIIAGLLGMLNGIVYVILGYFVYSGKG